MHLSASLQILAAALAVYGLLQFAKRFFPGLCGRHAVAWNLLFSFVAAVLVQRPEGWGDVFTVFLQTAGIAAGIHSTVRTLTKDAPDAPPAGRLLGMLLGIALLPLSGCAHRLQSATPKTITLGAVDQVDASANQVLQAAHGFAFRISEDSQSGAVVLSSDQRKAMNALNRTLNVADAMEIDYHQCGLNRATQPSLVACESANLVKYVTLVQEAFSDATITFAPAPTKK